MKSGLNIVVVIVALILPVLAAAQQWAGPDQNICGSAEGVFIGLESAPAEYCYKWSPTTNLEGDPCQARVLVKPEENTVYSVTVTGPNFSFVQIDEVEISVDFGAVEFNPGFAEPNGESNQSTAVVTNNPGNHPFTWSIVEPAGPQRLGCSINSTTGVISGCNMSGEITVRATRDDFPVCKAEKTFRVNTGVRDVEARDMSTANGVRVAKTGETLVLVQRNGVEFKAIPNENEQFGPSDITWAGPDAPATSVATWTSDHGTPTDFTISANDKSVNVMRKPLVTTVLTVPQSNLIALLTTGLQKFKPNREWNDLDMIGSCSPFTPTPPNISLAYTQNNTNKYNSPEEGMKYSITGTIGAGAMGRICFPPPYSSAPNPFGFYYTYAFLNGAVSLVLPGAVKDEGAPDQTWDVSGFSASGSLTAGLGADFGISVPGDVLTVNGSVQGATTITLGVRYASPHIEGQLKWDPLVVSGSLNVWITSPNNPIISVSRRYNIMDPYITNWTPVFTFD